MTFIVGMSFVWLPFVVLVSGRLLEVGCCGWMRAQFEVESTPYISRTSSTELCTVASSPSPTSSDRASVVIGASWASTVDVGVGKWITSQQHSRQHLEVSLPRRTGDAIRTSHRPGGEARVETRRGIATGDLDHVVAQVCDVRQEDDPHQFIISSGSTNYASF